MDTQGIGLRRPYLIFVGDASTAKYAKTAFGVRDWAPESCLAQLGLDGPIAGLGLPEMSPQEAAAAGAGSLLIGVASVGGGIPPAWEPILFQAVEAGLDIVSGMHTPLSDIAGLAEVAKRHGVALLDVRRPRQSFPIGTGRPRTGRRALTVGTDCTLGKKYAALALTRAMRARGVDADFRATGQTGIMISGHGIAIDAVVSDFVAGAAEVLSPDAQPAHWDIIEGQGSLFHPSYAGVTLGLLHGSQPDALVLCHDPTRQVLRALPDFPIVPLSLAAERYLEAARLTNPDVRLAGVSLNTSSLDDAGRRAAIRAAERELKVPAFDPLKSDLGPVIDSLLAEG
jgi:uncharacterized NAD-dependent epimerase/dehydratase family protein